MKKILGIVFQILRFLLKKKQKQTQKNMTTNFTHFYCFSSCFFSFFGSSTGSVRFLAPIQGSLSLSQLWLLPVKHPLSSRNWYNSHFSSSQHVFWQFSTVVTPFISGPKPKHWYGKLLSLSYSHVSRFFNRFPNHSRGFVGSHQCGVGAFSKPKHTTLMSTKYYIY